MCTFTSQRCIVASLFLLAFTSLSWAQDAHSNHNTAGSDAKSVKTKVLEAGAEMLQGEGPVGAIHAHLCGFHHYAGDLKRQVRSDHYCSHLNEDVLQCVIHDSDKKDARLIGIEYIISEELFKTLPDEEKLLWHSHKHEVMSGQLIAPNIPDAAEEELMKKLVNTYGKTWHTWQVDRGDKLPLGLPKLMMSFTADGQANPEMVAERDADLKVDSAEKWKERADLPAREVAPGADGWQHGKTFQIDDNLASKVPAGTP